VSVVFVAFQASIDVFLNAGILLGNVYCDEDHRFKELFYAEFDLLLLFFVLLLLEPIVLFPLLLSISLLFFTQG
jgi:hypothetical protein